MSNHGEFFISSMNVLFTHVYSRSDENKVFMKPKKKSQTLIPPKNGNVKHSMSKSVCYSTKKQLEVLLSSFSLTDVVERICFLLADIRTYNFAHTDIFKIMKLISHTDN